MSEQNALALPGSAKATSSEHTLSASEKLYINFEDEETFIISGNLPSFDVASICISSEAVG
jgi:hypothetical protein